MDHAPGGKSGFISAVCVKNASILKGKDLILCKLYMYWIAIQEGAQGFPHPSGFHNGSMRWAEVRGARERGGCLMSF